jgi:hypothetical protein
MNTRCKPLVMLGVGALTIWTTAVSAQIVECIEASGKKSYTEKCPPGTVKQREMMKGGSSALPGGSVLPRQTYQEQEADFRRRQIERQEAEAKAKAAQAGATELARKCMNARERLIGLESARRVGTINPATGELKVLSEDERLAAIDRTRTFIEQRCKD